METGTKFTRNFVHNFGTVTPLLEGPAIEQSSLRWPVSLRRRFVSALYYRTKKRWPCSPYGTNLAMRTERREIAAIHGLRTPPQPPVQNVAVSRPEALIAAP